MSPQVVRPPSRLSGRCWGAALAAIVLAVAAPPSMAGPLAGPTIAGPAAVSISPEDRGFVAMVLGLSPQEAAGMDDAALEARLLDYARVETGQRVRPSALDFRWTVQPRVRDLAVELRAAVTGGRLHAWVAGLSPAYPQYGALKAAQARYASLVAAGGWASLPEGGVLRPGDRGAAIPALRARLAFEGFAAHPSADPDLFDPALEAAVRTFQETHALAVDGVMGPATRRALNVPAEERVAQIEANLERWRWAPAAPAPDRLEVDTGGQEAVLYKDGSPVLRMRAIVGDPKHETPMLTARIEAVVANPPWIVPTSIAVNELLPEERRHPGSLARKHISWVNGQLRQRPGPDNALGLIKFDFTNPFGVYLHDTPTKKLFALPVRALSHGCMRLEKPHELAVALLEPEGVSAEALDSAIAAGATRRIGLRRPVPVYVQHWTVRVEADGRILFRPDIYGWDRRLAAALGAPRAGVTTAGAFGCDAAGP